MRRWTDCLALRIRETGTSTRRYHDGASKTPSFDTFTVKSDVHMCIWCVETGAERDAALDRLALRIREVGPSTRRYHDDASKIPSFGVLAVESGAYLAREDLSLEGCGVGLPRIAYLRSWALE